MNPDGGIRMNMKIVLFALLVLGIGIQAAEPQFFKISQYPGTYKEYLTGTGGKYMVNMHLSNPYNQQAYDAILKMTRESQKEWTRLYLTGISGYEPADKIKYVLYTLPTNPGLTGSSLLKPLTKGESVAMKGLQMIPIDMMDASVYGQISGAWPTYLSVTFPSQEDVMDIRVPLAPFGEQLPDFINQVASLKTGTKYSSTFLKAGIYNIEQDYYESFYATNIRDDNGYYVLMLYRNDDTPLCYTLFAKEKKKTADVINFALTDAEKAVFKEHILAKRRLNDPGNGFPSEQCNPPSKMGANDQKLIDTYAMAVGSEKSPKKVFSRLDCSPDNAPKGSSDRLCQYYSIEISNKKLMASLDEGNGLKQLGVVQFPTAS